MAASRSAAWFLAVGAAATLVHWGVVVALVESLAVRPLLANVAGWALAFCVSFYGHHKLSFRGHQAPAAAASTKPGRRILLVDDDPEIVESMRAVLESRGYQILVARDGNQGLVLAEGEEPDLVVLDMMMPKRSGFLVLEKLRRSRPNPMRVIMITANEGSRHKAYAEMLGVDDYIRKPFAMDRLLESVDRLLS